MVTEFRCKKFPTNNAYASQEQEGFGGSLNLPFNEPLGVGFKAFVSSFKEAGRGASRPP